MRTALVTGGTVRLGKAISDELRLRGWKVITTSHRKDANADIVADLSLPSGAAELYGKCLRLLDGVPPDAIVNNAAILDGDPERIKCLNFTSPSKLIMLMAGRETFRGSVVNILDASLPDKRFETYLETKKLLAEYTLKAAALFVDTINVNAVSPGPVIAKEGLGLKSGELPMPRPTEQDVAEAVAYLLGAKAVTGMNISVDSGLGVLNQNI
jgi:NAD(P)-dependent dehydrogenase (short-subunit alcohol dehydrogenase family)